MQEQRERIQFVDEEVVSNGAKSERRSSHVRITQPSSDLNRYIVDKFHPPTAKAKHVPFEAIDLSVYQPSARCLAFRTSEERLLLWISAFANRYNDLLTGNSAGYKVIWEEQDGYGSQSKYDKIIIHLVAKTTAFEEQLVVITIYVTTGRIMVQGKKFEDWSTHEFPVLLDIVNSLSARQLPLSSAQDKSLFASSLHNFFVHFIHFVADDEVASSGKISDPERERDETKTTSFTKAAELLSVTPNRLKTISTLRDTVGQLEADFTQFQLIR